jgi:hypothetical protein
MKWSNHKRLLPTVGVRSRLRPFYGRREYAAKHTFEDDLILWLLSLLQMAGLATRSLSWEESYEHAPSSVPTRKTPSKLHPATTKAVQRLSTSTTPSWISRLQPQKDILSVVSCRSVAIKSQYLPSSLIHISKSIGRTVASKLWYHSAVSQPVR